MCVNWKWLQSEASLGNWTVQMGHVFEERIWGRRGGRSLRERRYTLRGGGILSVVDSTYFCLR